MYNLFDRTIIVEFSASMWTANKKDKKASKELNAEKNSGTAARVHKSLLPGVQQLEAVQAHIAATRQWLYQNTKPWSDLGARLALMDNFQNISDYMEEAEAQYWVLVDAFLAQYPLLISAQAFKLNDLFDRTEYPTAEKLRARFGFHVAYLPVPKNDWAVRLEADTRNTLVQRLELEHQRRMDTLVQDNREAVVKALRHVVERLGYDENNKPNKFRSTLLSNLAETMASVRAFNLSNDQALQELVESTEQLLRTVDVEELRKNSDVRDDVRTRLEEATAADVWGF